MPLYRPGSSSGRNARGVSSTSSIGLRFGVYNPAGDALDLAVQIKGASEFQFVAVTLGGHAGQLPFDVVGLPICACLRHGRLRSRPEEPARGLLSNSECPLVSALRRARRIEPENRDR